MVDYRNTKTPSMHRRLGSATLSQVAFPRENNPDFPWEKSQWDNAAVKKKKKPNSVTLCPKMVWKKLMLSDLKRQTS